MMREILFRGKDINTNKWCYGGYVRKVLFKNTKDEKIRHYIFDGENAGPIVMHEVNPETVGQAIWLKDVNGNEIFEGDIVEEVKPEWDEPSRAVAVFEDNNFVFGYNTRAILSVEFFYNEIKIIGNIFDNEDLFEKISEQHKIEYYQEMKELHGDLESL